MHQLLTQLGLEHFLRCYTAPLVTTLCATVLVGDDSELAALLHDTFMWLANRLGPLLTAKYLTDKILQRLKSCYSQPDAYGQVSEGGLRQQQQPTPHFSLSYLHSFLLMICS